MWTEWKALFLAILSILIAAKNEIWTLLFG